jgi:ethanolamine utilization protein EutN
MRLGRVLGDVVAETRHPDLRAMKLLWVGEIDLSGRLTGRKELAVDQVDAGFGDRVLILDEGNSAAQVLQRPRGAIRTLIVGVVDEVDRTAPSRPEEGAWRGDS